ncbi:glycosyltransferase family 52 protein, partial [Acinetobacter baumannii]|nr:glycosyltransferase family 52 protein [Acinetobacter baumannii]
MLDKKKSLVICLTPLQMIIAEKVVAKQPSVDLLVIALNDNNKYKYYFDNFQHPNLKKQYYLFDNNQSIFSKILKVVKFKNFFEINDYYENVYISSIDNKYIHSILSKVKFDNLYTYDDGTANIIQDSVYFKQSFRSKLKDAVFRLIGINFNLNKIKKIVKKHYT